MGTWNTQLSGNDTFQDIYQAFFDLYNQGQNPVEIFTQIQSNFAEMFEDYDDRNNSLFGLALAQWETKSLSPEIFKKVKEIIENGENLRLWKELGADEKTLKQREKALEKFLKQISTERDKPKRRVRPKLEFTITNLINIISPDNLKKFTVNEEYINGKYLHTSGTVMWAEGGGAVLYYTGEDKNISAKWLNKQTLEIIHENDIVFEKKEDNAFFCGDEILIVYKLQ